MRAHLVKVLVAEALRRGRGGRESFGRLQDPLLELALVRRLLLLVGGVHHDVHVVQVVIVRVVLLPPVVGAAEDDGLLLADAPLAAARRERDDHDDEQDEDEDARRAAEEVGQILLQHVFALGFHVGDLLAGRSPGPRASPVCIFLCHRPY